MTKQTLGSNPFTPRSGHEPKVFLGREAELALFSKHLAGAMQKRYDHFVVLGGWGTGKTTLLKEYRKQAQAQGILTSFVSVHEFAGNDLSAPVSHLLTQTTRTLPIKFSRLKRFAKYLQGVGITLPIVGGGIQIGEKKKFDGDPQVVLLEGLLQLWQELKRETDALVVLLDDVQYYDNVPQFLGILKNVLSDDDIARKTGYLFVLASTHEGWSSFLHKNNPIGRYFSPIVTIQNFSKPNTLHIVEETLKGSGVVFAKGTTEAVYDYTEGHPYQLQILCYYLYENQIEGRVGEGQLNTAIIETLDNLGPVILDALYHRASNQEKAVLQSMSVDYRTYSFDGIRKQLKVSRISPGKGALATMLSRLSEKGLLIKPGRGQYRVLNRLFHEFLKRQ